MSLAPRLVLADASGAIHDDPRLLMLRGRAGKWGLPEPGELIPLPRESELFLLPGRRAVGLDPATGAIKERAGAPVAAFAAPGHTLSAHAACIAAEGAPILPLFAYGAVGYARGRFWICAAKVDPDPRQQFSSIKPGLIEAMGAGLLREHPSNRLVGHIINNCARRYGCPAAKNFALGRHEAPLPTARACNARCLGCISQKSADSPLATTPQCRIAFTPEPEEIAEVMAIHGRRERRAPIYSFGQGCEGDPLANPRLLAAGIRLFRGANGKGTINCNTNASDPDAVALVCEAGLTSLRASLSSALPEFYDAYHRPQGYSLREVREALKTARRLEVFAGLNLLYFPGLTDTAPEIEALSALCRDCGVSMIQLRNLNIDPAWHLANMPGSGALGASVGLREFMRRMKEKCPWLCFGYFNPYLGERARIDAPMPA